MKRIYITGMSGTGKTSVVNELKSRGFNAIDTDDDSWTELRDNGDGPEWLLCEERLRTLLEAPLDGPLFISGCCANQGKFRSDFDYVILFSAPLNMMRERIMARSSNPYGKSEGEWEEIVANTEYAQPLLKKSADAEIDTAAMSISQIVDYLERLACGETSIDSA